MDARQSRLGVSAEQIAEFCRRWNVIEFGLFGSAVRDDFREDSDVDVLVTFQPGSEQTLTDIAAMEEELQALFGRKVDLVEKRLIGKNPYRRHNILADHRVLYPEPRDVLSIREGPPRFDRDLGCIWDIVQAAKRIVEITRRSEVDAEVERLAIERLFTIIGEAARGLSQGFRAAHPGIPWNSIIAERNILIHNYRDVEEEKVWKIALESVPRLIEELSPMLAGVP